MRTDGATVKYPEWDRGALSFTSIEGGAISAQVRIWVLLGWFHTPAEYAWSIINLTGTT